MNDLRPLPADIIARLLPEALPSIAEIEAQYPPRTLPEGAKVTRFAPSPTGYMHIGAIYTALVNERAAHQSGGIFFIRIEDTDTAREVKGAAYFIQETLPAFGIKIDEAPFKDKEVGAYAPYFQSKREKIYKAYIKRLLEQGWAYPCFLTTEELNELREGQEASNLRPGYYGKYAVSRDLTDEQIRANLDANKPFVIRYRANGDYDKKMRVQDLVKGERDLAQNDTDDVILKSSSPLPTYHFAHVIDDHLMGTTHVIRADEWLNSLTKHIQMFAMMGWKAPKYAHISPIEKMDGNSRRKLSKRKDPECDSGLMIAQGYTPTAIVEYLMNIINSNFEDWRKANPKTSVWDFKFALNKMNESGSLLDFVKLASISREVVGRMNATEVFGSALVWADKYSPRLSELLQRDPDYCHRILDIERAGCAKVRKDIAVWADVLPEVEYFFDDAFTLTRDQALELLAPITAEKIRAIIADFKKTYAPTDDKNVWFEKVKAIAVAQGFAASGKEQQANPTAFLGNVSDVAKIFRVLLKGTVQSPDLHSIMTVMGQERVFKRLDLI